MGSFLSTDIIWDVRSWSNTGAAHSKQNKTVILAHMPHTEQIIGVHALKTNPVFYSLSKIILLFFRITSCRKKGESSELNTGLPFFMGVEFLQVFEAYMKLQAKLAQKS